MKFDPVDFGKYNKPPFYPQYLSRGETKKLVSFDDEQLVELDRLIDKASDQYDLDKAKGILLDRLGKLKDVPRDGNDDELYRLLIRLQILLDTTDCSVPDIIKIIKFIYSSEEVRLMPKYPAGIIILHDGENDSIDFNKYLAQIVGAGIGYETRELFNIYEKLPIKDFETKKAFKDDCDRFFLPPVKRDGTYKRDGTMKRNRFGQIKDYLKMKNKNPPALERIEVKDYLNYGMRWCIRRDGTHRRDGTKTRGGYISLNE
jgi:hypothetical protein